MIPYKETDYGFEYGAVTVTRLMSDERGVLLEIAEKKRAVQVWVSAKGHSIRVTKPMTKIGYESN